MKKLFIPALKVKAWFCVFAFLVAVRNRLNKVYANLKRQGQLILELCGNINHDSKLRLGERITGIGKYVSFLHINQS